MSDQETKSIHRGQVLKKEVYNSGIKIAELARRINKSRRFIYLMFENKDVPLHLTKSVCDAIRCDFTRAMVEDKIESKETLSSEVWKEKYIRLLEEYNEFLKKDYIK